MLIREERPEDIPAIYKVNEMAFGRGEEAQLVDRLRARKAIVHSLVAVQDGEVAGHVLFSPVLLHSETGVIHVIAGLGPAAVLPGCQGQGIGKALIEAGVEHCRDSGYRALIVLGHPEYYPRFGFLPAVRSGIRCAFEVPDEAFMVLELVDGALDGVRGVAHYHPEFAGV
jgi:putative acetyltransferase